MTWELHPVPNEEVTAEALFDLFKKHRLIVEDLVSAIDYYRRVAENCAVVRVMDGDEWVGEGIFSDIIPGASAEFVFVPKPKYFSSDQEYQGPISEVLGPVFQKLFSDYGLRRITATVPETRNRTTKALRACGFKKEGVMRDALKFNRKPAEAMVIMGLLPGECHGVS